VGAGGNDLVDVVEHVVGERDVGGGELALELLLSARFVVGVVSERALEGRL